MDLTNYKAMLADAVADVERLSSALEDAKSVVRFCQRRIEELTQMTLPLPLAHSDQVLNLSDKSVPDAAMAVIRAAGRPLRAKEIAERMVAGGFEARESLPITVTTAIRRRDDLFRKVDRGLFALRNGDH